MGMSLPTFGIWATSEYINHYDFLKCFNWYTYTQMYLLLNIVFNNNKINICIYIIFKYVLYIFK